jgi:hypothetical protein
MPAILKFVNYPGLQIDLTAISSSGPSAQISKATVLPQKNIGDDVTGLVTFGPDFFNMFIDEFFVMATNGIHEIGIPTSDPLDKSKPRTCFTDTVTFSAATGILNGTHEVKLDFQAFDFDNDGVKEDCSGNAKEPPICVRFWLGMGETAKPFIAGVFERPPIYLDKCEESYCPAGRVCEDTDCVEQVCTCSQYVLDELDKIKNISITNPKCDDGYCANHADATCTCDENFKDKPIIVGEGRFKIRAWDIEEGFNLLTRYNYNEKHPENTDTEAKKYEKDVEYLFHIWPSGSSFGQISGFDIEKFDGHSALSQVGPQKSAFKSLNISTQIEGEVEDYKDIDLNYIGQYVEGQDFWGGKLLADFFLKETNEEYIIDEPSICASPLPRDGRSLVVDESNCQSVGGDKIDIRARDVPFVSPLKDPYADVAFPTDFPETPPDYLNQPQCKP